MAEAERYGRAQPRAPAHVVTPPSWTGSRSRRTGAGGAASSLPAAAVVVGVARIGITRRPPTYRVG